MTLALYAHPFSSYCWKVLIALWEKAIPFEYRSLADPAHKAALQPLSPFGRFPVLVEDGVPLLETSIIIERLDRIAPEPRMIPADPDAALEVRLLDRLSDNYLMNAMTTPVFDALRPEAERDPTGVRQAREMLHRSYRWWNARMTGREWAAGPFGLADCAAAPALFYADWVERIPPEHEALLAYRRRLVARPSVARAVDEARPSRPFFPLGGDPGRD